jgi:hypothetical protein
LKAKGQWQSHISSVGSRAWKCIGIVRAFKFIFNRDCLTKLYFTFIRQLLEHTDVVCNYCNNYEKQKIESNQMEAARIITGET